MFGFNILGTGFKAIKSNIERLVFEYNNSAPETKKGKTKRSRKANRTAKGRSKLGKTSGIKRKSVVNSRSAGGGPLATRGVARGRRLNSD